jgi:RNA polymerase sigma-70 factor (ECF subfamily)
MMDEIQLIADAQRGDLDAYNSLVLLYQDMAYNLAFRILSDDDSAEDAAQNAFISAYRNLSKYRGGSFRAWLLRMVTNNCYDELRRLKRHPTLPLEPVNNGEGDEAESPRWLADGSASPEQSLEKKDLERAIQHCLDRLPEDFRTVIIMIEMEGMDYKEVSFASQKPLGTIKSRLARARLRMQNCLKGFGELLPAKFRLEQEAG